MKKIKQTSAAICMLLLAACQKDAKLTEKETSFSANETSKAATASSSVGDNTVGYVYTLNNQVSANRVMTFSRSVDGSLEFEGATATGGTGTGGGLGNQGAVVLAKNKEILLAVNAGSNSVSSFTISDHGLTLVSTVSSGGMQPVSIAQYGNILFVLNAAGTNNISGLYLMDDGTLQPIANSTRPLTAASTGPAQVSFVNEGKVLVITEKATNKIVTYTVNNMGIPGAMHSITSSSATPFGFAVGRNGNVFVSEAVGGAPGASVLSSYSIGYDGSITLVNGSVGAGQTAACWVAITNNGKYAYTTNTANDNLSTFGITNAGGISVSEAISAITGAGPIDAALSNNSKYLYILNGAGHSIDVFSVASDGTLNHQQNVPGLPVGATGLAAK